MVEALSPRIRGHRVNPDDGPPTGDAAQAQVWVPRGGGRIPADFLSGLPSLRLVQLLSAGAEQFVGRLPEGVVLCNARGAHTPATAEWAVTAALAAQRDLPPVVRQQGEGGWAGPTPRSMGGAPVLLVGARDIRPRVGPGV